MNAQLALSSQKIGEITKVLTVVSAVVIPLTFIVGIYGMNFDNMPKLHWHTGCCMTWALIGIVILCQNIFSLRRQQWL